MTCAITLFINFRLRIGIGYYLGLFDDFTPNWFKSIGYSLGLTFLLKSFGQIMTTFGAICWRGCMRLIDRNCSGNKSTTHKATQHDYEELYTNPDFEVDFGYTEILKVLFVCLTLSTLLPYIFFIATIFLIVMYWKSKVACKSYRF